MTFIFTDIDGVRFKAGLRGGGFTKKRILNGYKGFIKKFKRVYTIRYYLRYTGKINTLEVLK